MADSFGESTIPSLDRKEVRSSNGYIALVLFCVAMFQHYVFPGGAGSFGLSIYIGIILLAIGSISLVWMLKKQWKDGISLSAKIITALYVVYIIGGLILFAVAPPLGRVVYMCLANNGSKDWGGTRTSCINQTLERGDNYFYCSFAGSYKNACLVQMAFYKDDINMGNSFSQSEKEDFYYKMALKNGTVSYCENVATARKDSCYLEVALINNNPAQCMMISESNKDPHSERDNCLLRLSSWSKESCEYLTSTNPRKNECLMKVSPTLKMNDCSQFTVPMDIYVCSRRVGYNSKDHAECQSVQTDQLRFNACISGLAIATKDKNYCSEMKPGEAALAVRDDMSFAQLKLYCEYHAKQGWFGDLY